MFSDAAQAKRTDVSDEVCEATFFDAEYEQEQGHKEKAISLYRRADSICPGTFVEYGSARAALREWGLKP
jgi:hypothetical protein